MGIEPDFDPALIRLTLQINVLFGLLLYLEVCLPDESLWEAMIRQWGPPNPEFWINAYTGEPRREMPLGEGTPGDYSHGLDGTVPYVVFYYRTLDGGIAMRPVTYRTW
jgi:hypothetical protein